MPLIGFRQQAPAHLLANYLKKKHIAVKIQSEGANGYALYLKDETQRSLAKPIVEDFLKNPNDPKYQDAAWQDGAAVNIESSGSLMPFSFSSLLASPVVFVVLLICTSVYLYSWLGGLKEVEQTLMIQSLSTLVNSGQWWRLLTPAFIHFSAIHIVFNLLWWWILGRPVENKFGGVFLILFLCVSGVLSNVAQLFVAGPNFGGLSGVVYALMGFVWWTGWLKPQWGIGLPKPMVGFMLISLVIGYTGMLWVNVANTAHTAGLISGCVIAFLVCGLTKNKS